VAEGDHASLRPALPGRRRYYEPMRQSSPLTAASVREPCAAGLCRLRSAPAAVRTFPTLAPQSRCGVAWTLTPGCSSGALTRYFPKDGGLAIGTSSLAHQMVPAEQLRQGGIFRGYRPSLMFRRHHSLGPPVAPTARPLRVLGGQAVTTRPSSGSLPAPSTGIAPCRKRATGTAGLPPAGFRPCRLLLSPIPPIPADT
jgi:hypothetical protein